MADGIMIDSSGIVVSCVYGFTGAPPAGQTFIQTDPAGIKAGTAAQTAYLQSGSALNSGIAITSTSGNWTATFPTLTDASGTNVWLMILAELSALQMSTQATFADGNVTIQWPDVTGKLYTLTPAQFVQFAKAVGAYVASVRNFANGVTGATIPTATATIA